MPNGSLLSYLQSIAPKPASNREIGKATGVQPHQQVFQITQRLKRAHGVRGWMEGREWVFAVGESEPPPPPVDGNPSKEPTDGLTPAQFERLAQRVLGARFGTRLSPGTVPRVPKEFDLVSEDRSVVGDAKYYTLVKGSGRPPAKFATIAEHVWLLEKTPARHRFLVFGNQREVPVQWLTRYGHLAQGVQFFFLTDEGVLEELLLPEF